MNLDFFRDLGPIQRMVTGKPETENKFYSAHSNVLTNLREPVKNEELYLLSLSGLIPFKKVPALEDKLQDLEDAKETEQSDKLQEDVHQAMLELIDWTVKSDWEHFDDSLGEESDLNMFSNGVDDLSAMPADMTGSFDGDDVGHGEGMSPRSERYGSNKSARKRKEASKRKAQDSREFKRRNGRR
mmetsp:Transcript_31724/g.42013  ORF Transcript_31724/g.42013 Transcript_31724/m.42013 type:complete len:185 (+) Transcript_31724:55-609(+)